MLKKISRNEKLTFQELSPEEKEARGILGRLSGPIAGFTKPTRNGRKYTEELWEKAFDNDLVKEMFKNGGLPGELDHPADREQTDPTKIAIMMHEPPRKDDSGHLIATVDILNTPCGQIAYQLAKYGFNFGISSRGTGDVYDDGEGEVVDPESYQLNAFDLVLIPACEDARLNMQESLDVKNKNLKVALAESLKKANSADRKIMKDTLKDLNIKLDESLFDDPDFEYEDAIGLNLEFLNGAKFTIVEHVADLDMWKLEPKNPEAVKEASEKSSEDGMEYDGFMYININELNDKLDDKSCVITEGITRYSDVVPEEDRKYWYFTTHGVGPGTIPSDLKVLKTQEGKNKKGTEGLFVQLNGVLNTSELKKFDMIELSPEVDEKLVAPTEDDLKPILDLFDKFGLEIEDQGETWSGRIHYQLRKELDHEVTKEDLMPIYKALIELSDTTRYEYEMPITFSIGVHRDGNNIISLAVDVDKKYIKESQESEQDSKDKNAEETEEVDDIKSKEDGSIEAELKELLLKNKKLKDDNLALQEKLSVCNAKEIKIEEELNNYKLAVSKLSDTANQVRPLKESVSELTKANKTLGQVIKTTRSKYKTLTESNNSLTSKNSEVENQLNDALKKLESLEEKLKKLTQALDENTKIVEENKKTISKYAKAYNGLKEKLIDAKADAYGISKEDLVEKLGKNYNVSDIDVVCEDLRNTKLNLNKLPFRINESTKVSVKKQRESITRDFDRVMGDDEVSESLLNLANL